MRSFDVHETPISGLNVLQRKPIQDERGYLCRLFCADELAAAGFSKSISQINHTLTVRKGTVRGMHYQLPPHAEIKIVSCIRGEIFDVAVDLRKGSPTFMNWHGEALNAENRCSLLIPEGFAHGFQTLTDDCELIYFHSAPYVQQSEGALNAFDPRLDIHWPLPVSEISARDHAHPMTTAAFEGI
ncbi:MAG: dTDP-4-dehydrorhamnose 3,5-epimerase, partial [Gammaproteobacteria bacterium]|nr:dTDP-4-dehydrorhamnose 3,5-epimerase [Gammaproteobacteria bacterium]NIO63477.1 dTDP-4-dehydrorhamnose 3,5-epimerase [Gammaproteobacteria bacterium]NIT40842.1 dTDP-4-dehydrorhamnose 3,5-epimerase [Gammaproteobacteria bacterium]